MADVFFEVENGEVFHFERTEKGKKRISRKEYISARIKEAEKIYDKIVEKAIKNGFVYNSWVQRHFKLDWYGASHIVDKMRDEGICAEYDPNFGACKILAS